MKKIIFVTVSMRGGGTERVISVLANRLVKMGYDVSIVMIAEPTVEYDLNEKIRVVCVSKATGGSFVGRIKRIWNMRREFSQERDAKIISLGTVANLFTLIAGWGLPNPIVISERNDPNRLNHRPIKKTEVLLRNCLYRSADRLVLQTFDVLECFPDAIRKKCVIIPNPISSLLPKANTSGNREKTVITAGRLTEQKNHKLLIDAFCEFHKEYPEYRLIIYGKGELEAELIKYIKTLNMESSISVHGFCDNLYTKLGTEGMYVSSSDWEGISNSLLEALAMGIPTIATDCPVGGTRMCIQDGVNGYMIPVRDKEALLDKMISLAEDIELRKMFSENAVRIREEYSEVVVTEKWLKCFD